ncbi:hypothetical protein K5X82_15635 [Halosquirtibacter xylanolyticus]|uniref:glycoside hydrolase family 30 protein n=1 Tax=Halosquirtibacter xylanolyticus TaxID=3374599 RepID=UPI003749051A|nr:hypothetical protein K5X82_15635 [Prolixibacteraceae bacterium]
MNNYLTLIAFTLFFTSTVLHAQDKAKVYYVDLVDGQEVLAHPVKEFPQNPSKTKPVKINLYPDMEMQTLKGVGASFNEIGGVSLMSLHKKNREILMENLFSEKGAHLSFCRTAIGASDFGVNAYSYSERADDYEMKHFSIKREKGSVIPYIQAAFKYNPEMRLFASPWSPPAWMKYSNVMDQGNQFKAKNKLKEDQAIYRAYALYFAKYVEAYAKKGIRVDRILIQNETDANTKYPSCVMKPDQMYEVAQNMRKVFKDRDVNTEIWAGTFRTHGALDAVEFAYNKRYRDAVDGLGIQYTRSQYISDMNLLKAGKPAMHTEGVCFNGKNSVDQAFTRLGEIALYINRDIENYCYWNMILDQTGKSGWGWKQNSMINIDQETKKITYNPDYSVIYLISKYLQPGTKRFVSFSKEDEMITIKSDKAIYILVQNKSNKVKNYDCFVKGNKVTKAVIPAHSVAVIELENNI